MRLAQDINSPTKLLLGLHSHQPIDNFNNVVYEAIEKSYKPFFETVKNDDWFRFSLHISGWLFEFIKNNDKELFTLIKSCYDKGMIEFFTGGFYEPVLAAIPKRDRKLQIKKMNRFLFNNFGARPRGLWLTERVWSESIVSTLCDVGVEYILTDDYHFISAGYDEKGLDGYFVTEEGGDKLGVFPISKQLRYMMPFKKASTVIEELERESRRDRASIIFDDGEKFGLWPKTYEWVYEKGWLREFLDGVKASKYIKPQTYAEFFDNEKPVSLAYLPEVSYYEMGEWSLGADDIRAIESVSANTKEHFGEAAANKFVKGGIWKNFLVKYDESNRIHKKTLRLSTFAKHINSEQFDEAVLKTQANDALWHGVFGGVYLPNLRDNCYKHIIECEQKLGFKANIEASDENFDGYIEARLRNDYMVAVFEEKNGAQMTDFSSFKTLFNYQNTLTRRKEACHEKFFAPKSERVESEDGIDTIHDIDIDAADTLKENLHYDWYLKNSFIEHISDDGFDAHSLFACSFREYGDFVNMPFVMTDSSKNGVLFERNGGIYRDGKIDTKITKKIEITKNGLVFDIAVKSVNSVNCVFAEEFNLHFCDYDAISFNDESLDTMLTLKQIKTLRIRDGLLKQDILFEIDAAYDVLVCKVNTVSQNEKGVELCTQGVAIAFVAPFDGDLHFVGRLNIEEF